MLIGAACLQLPQSQEEYEDGDANGQLLAKLDQLSDEEVNSLLTDMLDKAEISE